MDIKDMKDEAEEFTLEQIRLARLKAAELEHKMKEEAKKVDSFIDKYGKVIFVTIGLVAVAIFLSILVL